MQPLYERARRVFCNSRVLSRLAEVSGLRIPVIIGSDLTADLITRAAKQRLTIAVIGPTGAACARLQDRYPGLNVVIHTPPMWFIKSELEVQKCVDFVVKTQAPLVFLAVGNTLPCTSPRLRPIRRSWVRHFSLTVKRRPPAQSKVSGCGARLPENSSASTTYSGLTTRYLSGK